MCENGTRKTINTCNKQCISNNAHITNNERETCRSCYISTENSNHTRKPCSIAIFYRF